MAGQVTAEDVEDPELAALIPSAQPSPYGERIATWHFPAEGSAPADSRPSGLLDINSAANQSMPAIGSAGSQPTPRPAAPPPAKPAEDKEDPELAAMIPKLEKKADERSMLEKLQEKVYPTKTEAEGGVINPDLEKLPDWTLMAPVAEHPINSARAALGTLISTKEETAAVIKEQFPGTKVEEKGAYLVITPKGSGQSYAWKPGIRTSDFARAALTIPVAGAGAAAVGAGVAAALPGAVGAGLTGLGSTLAGAGLLELEKYSAGGGFNPLNLAGAVAGHGVIQGIGAGLGAVGRRVFGTAPEVGGALAGAEGATLQPGANAPAAPQMTAEQLGPEMAAAGRGMGSSQRAVAGQAMADPELMTAARNLTGPDGRPLIESMTPAQLSQNPTYQSLANAGTGAVESHNRTIRGLGHALTDALDAAGAKSNQGSLERAAKTAIEDRLARAKAVVDKIYGLLDGADAVEASGTEPARAAVKGLVAPETRTAIPKFKEAIAGIEKELGTLPDPVKKFRNQLLSGGEIPTRKMVDRMRKIAGADIGKGGKKYGIDIAHALYDALDEDQLTGGESFKGEVESLSKMGKVASITHREMNKMVHGVLGKELEHSLTDKLESEVVNLAHGDEREFNRLIMTTPDEMRPDLAKFALRQFVDRSRNLDIRSLNDWYKAMEGNRPSWNALKAHIGPDLAENLERVGKLSRNVEAAMDAAAPVDFKGTFREPWNLPGLAAKGLKTLAVAKLTTPLGAAGYAIADLIFAKKAALAEAMGEYLASPAARQFMTAELKGTVTAGMIRNMMEVASFRKVMHLANIPVHARQAWLASGMGSPLPAGAPWNQPQERPQ